MVNDSSDVAASPEGGTKSRRAKYPLFIVPGIIALFTLFFSLDSFFFGGTFGIPDLPGGLVINMMFYSTMAVVLCSTLCYAAYFRALVVILITALWTSKVFL